MDTIDKADVEIVYDSKIPRTKPSGHLEIEPKETKPEGEEIDAFEFIDLPDEVYPEYMR